MLLGVLLAGLAVWQSWRADAAEAEAARLRAEVADYRQAADVVREHSARAKREAEARAVLDRDWREMGGRDAPLSDYLGRAAGKLWP